MPTWHNSIKIIMGKGIIIVHEVGMEEVVEASKVDHVHSLLTSRGERSRSQVVNHGFSYILSTRGASHTTLSRMPATGAYRRS